MKKTSPIIIQKNARGKGPPKKIQRDGTKNLFQQRVLEIVRAIPRGQVLTYGQVAALADTPRAARQVGRILYASGRTVPWQRVINSYGGISTYKVGSGELQRALLEKEGITFRVDGTLDLKKYQWQPGLRIIKKMRLPEEVAFQINARLPFSKDNPKIKKTRPGMGRNDDRKANHPFRNIPS
ncbi:MAG: MGMT family protein [Deltaproteobacteria bacterium]|nr:MGMT family protein [Deltaproteobacteria bacterium]